MQRAHISILGLLAIAAIVAVGLAFVKSGGSSTQSQPRPTATLSPALIIRAHSVPVSGIMGGTQLRGALYPGFPGPNTLTIIAPAGPPSGYLELVVSMPGMPMKPVSARIPTAKAGYQGTIVLPMFGDYVATVTLVRGGNRQVGTARLSLPLSISR